MESRLCNTLSSGDFLNLDGPNGMAEAWESRECFFERLGLNEKHWVHRRIFRQMLREAIVGRSIVLHSNDAFAPSLTVSDIPGDMVVPDQVLYDAMRGIYDAASAQSKAIYDLVTDQDGYCWILRWTLRWALDTRCQTCLDGAQRDVLVLSSKLNCAASDRVDSASPGDHIWSAHKRKSPTSESQHKSGSASKRQRVKGEAAPLLLTRRLTDSPTPMPTNQQWSTSRGVGRRNTSQTELSAHKSETDLRIPEAGPSTPMSLSSMLNPEVMFQE